MKNNKDKSIKLFRTRKALLIFHGIFMLIVATIIGILLLKLYKCNQDINILEENQTVLENGKDDVNSDLPLNSEDFNNEDGCTLSVNNLNEIHPIQGCTTSDVTLHNLLLNEKPVTIQAIFYSLDTDDFYSLDLYIDSKKVESDFYASKDDSNSLPSYIWRTDSIQFLTLLEDNEPSLLGVYSMVAGQAYDKFLLILNSQGESVLELEFFESNNFNSEIDSIENTFTVKNKGPKGYIEYCCTEENVEYCKENNDIYPDTIAISTKTYIINNGTLEIQKVDNLTYGDCIVQ